MRARPLNLTLIILAASVVARAANTIEADKARAFVGRDLQLVGGKVTSAVGEGGRQTLVFDGRFSCSVGGDKLSSDSAVVWLERTQTVQGSRTENRTRAWLYLEGKVATTRGKGARLSPPSWRTETTATATIVRLDISGEVFVTADSRGATDARGLGIYRRGFAAVSGADAEFASGFAALSPVKAEEEKAVEPAPAAEEQPAREWLGFGFLERFLGRSRQKEPTTKPAVEPAVRLRYPVNIAPAGETPPKIEGDGNDTATVIGRFYLWQKQDERGRLLELQADGAVLFYSSEKKQDVKDTSEAEQTPAKGMIEAIYVCGDVVMTERQRTIRASELYYDFEQRKGVAVDAVMRTFDAGRGIPIYVRAGKLRRLAESRFAAEDIVVTSSEFYKPQISLGAASIIVEDTTPADEQTGTVSKKSYDAQMRDVRLKLNDKTIFRWPFMRSNLERPDVPLKSVRVGHDSIWGTSVETSWYLSRLLGLKEPEGTNGTFDLDYYGKRGVGTGMQVDYTNEDHFGRMLGYIVNDTGEDRLGRDASRRDIEPPRELRGRFGWVHREFMPYNWQLTTGVNYESDEHFVESYYRSEYNLGEDRETYVHLKRIEDNWGLAFLGKGRLNDFADELEEAPSAEFHLAGQSFFDDKFTLYSDSQAGQFQQRIGNEHTTAINEERFGFASHRTELDMPLNPGGFKAVPFVAGTAAYDDRSGFMRSLVDGTNSGSPNEDAVAIGEAGLRLSSQYWKVYPGVKSRLWDLNGLRHIIKPQASASVFEESDSVVKQRDVLYAGLSQRLQTKRGAAEKQRTVDWMRLDAGFTWVTDSEESAGAGPDRFLWNRPMTPLRLYSMPRILNGDLEPALRRFELYGPRRNYFSTDYIWRASDTTAFLSDFYYDMQGGTIEQFDVGISRTRWPDLSYYIGSRYLKRVEVLDERGSNAFVFAATYVVDPRYTLVFSQQFDFDYGANIESDVTLIRRYHRVFWGLTYGTDGSLDQQSIVFSIWPEGVPEMAIGSRRYMNLSTPSGHQ